MSKQVTVEIPETLYQQAQATATLIPQIHE